MLDRVRGRALWAELSLVESGWHGIRRERVDDCTVGDAMHHAGSAKLSCLRRYPKLYTGSSWKPFPGTSPSLVRILEI